MILPERVLGKLGASWIKSGWAKGAISSLTIFLWGDEAIETLSLDLVWGGHHCSFGHSL